jgi:hypothetical protein
MLAVADLPKLHEEALHAVTVARDAYDHMMTAQRVAKDGNTENTRYWINVALGRMADTINAAQATLYSATQSLKDSPLSGAKPPSEQEKVSSPMSASTRSGEKQ